MKGIPNLDFSSRRSTLGSGTILVVEDEYLIATDLEAQIRDDGGRMARLALSIEAAEEELRENRNIAGVILDVNIGDVPSLDIADALMRSGIPFVFFTGYRSVSLPDRFGAVPRVAKPANWRALMPRS